MPVYAWIAIGGTVAAIVAALILALNKKSRKNNYTTLRTMDYSYEDLKRWYQSNKSSSKEKVLVATVKSLSANTNFSETIKKNNIIFPQEENAIILAVVDESGNIGTLNFVVYDSIEDSLKELLDSNNGVVIMEDK